jgi:hypothetical protein
MNFKRSSFLLVMAAATVLGTAVSGPAARAGSITYTVTVDTSSLSGTTGAVQFTMVAGNTPAPTDTAAVSAFSPQAGLVPPPTTSPNVTGDLSSTVNMDNQSPSLYFETFAYGSSLTFQVALTSTDGGAGAPDTTFAFYLFDQNGNPVSNSSSPSGELLDINIAGQGGGFSPVTFGPPDISVVSSVPEPSSMVLLAAGLATAFGASRIRRRA